MKTKKTMVGAVNKDILKFTVGKDAELDLVLTEADCIGTAAHVTMLSKLAVKPKLISEQEKKKIISGLIEIIRKSRTGKFKISQSDQDVHLAVERTLTKKLGSSGKKMHAARSRNDQVSVDLRLYGKEKLLEVMEESHKLASLLIKFAKKNAAVPMVGYTHTRPGMPSSVGLWSSAHAETILDDVMLVWSAYKHNDRCPLGSAAGYGVSLDIDRNLTSKLLGFTAPIHNVLSAGNARGKCESVILSALSQIMITLSRMSTDLIMFSMPELGYFSLPKECCTGSSIMPQKSNPDVLELIRAKASKVLGYQSAAAAIISGLPSGYNRDLQEVKELYIEGIDTTINSLKAMSLLVANLKANKKALKDAFTPEVFAADEALNQVAKGKSFRDAYDHVKLHLNELGDVDPLEAIAAKVHLGAPAGLDFEMMASWSASIKKYVSSERKKFHGAISKLLGSKYPEL